MQHETGPLVFKSNTVKISKPMKNNVTGAIERVLLVPDIFNAYTTDNKDRVNHPVLF